jgi:hypothetical protein
MVYVSPVQTFYHKLAREAEVLAHSQGFLIDVLSREVLCNAAVVGV